MSIQTWQSQVAQCLGVTHEEQIKVMQREIDELRAWATACGGKMTFFLGKPSDHLCTCGREVE